MNEESKKETHDIAVFLVRSSEICIWTMCKDWTLFFFELPWMTRIVGICMQHVRSWRLIATLYSGRWHLELHYAARIWNHCLIDGRHCPAQHMVCEEQQVATEGLHPWKRISSSEIRMRSFCCPRYSETVFDFRGPKMTMGD